MEDNTARSSTTMVTFAEAVAVITTECTIQILDEVTNWALKIVADWMEDNGLELSVHKTEVIVLTNKRCYIKSSFIIKNVCIQSQEQLRYMGVELYRILGFKKHIVKAAAKIHSTALLLSNSCPILEDLGTTKGSCWRQWPIASCSTCYQSGRTH